MLTAAGNERFSVMSQLDSALTMGSVFANVRTTPCPGFVLGPTVEEGADRAQSTDPVLPDAPTQPAGSTACFAMAVGSVLANEPELA